MKGSAKVVELHTALSGAEPLSETDLELLSKEWLERTIKRLTPAQRDAARRLLLRKAEPKGVPGRPRRWTAAEFRVLRAMYDAHKSIGKIGYNDNVAMLARVWGVVESTMRKKLTEARRAEKAIK